MALKERVGLMPGQILERVTTLVLTSTKGKKTVSVVAHTFLLLLRAKLQYKLSISPADVL